MEQKQKTGTKVVEETLEQKIARLEAENKALEEKVNASTDLLKGEDAKFFRDMEHLDKKGRVDTMKIKVIEKNDHKNISLWTLEGKRIGPLHPHNAKRTYNDFYKRGVRLLVEQPTAEQIAAYKETSEYKQQRAKIDAIRAERTKSKKKGEVERLAALIAASMKTTPDQINKLASSPQPLSSGR